MSIAKWITTHAEHDGSRVAIRCDKTVLTYVALEQRIARWATTLSGAFGVRAGDRVALLAPNRAEYLELLFACSWIGAIFMPLNWRLTANELSWQLNHAGPKIVFNDVEFDELARNAVAEIPNVASRTIDDVALSGVSVAPGAADNDIHRPLLLVYTSGTTGLPKGAVLSEQALMTVAENGRLAFAMTAHDRVLTTIPMFHVGGLNIQTLPAMLVGAEVNIERGFDPGDTLNSIREMRPTLFIAVPTMAQALVSHPNFGRTDFSSLRCLCSGSSNVAPEVITPWHERGVAVTQVYGLTESGPTATVVPLESAFERSASAGRPASRCEVRVGEGNAPGAPGEIQLRGPGLFSFYWANEDATRAAFTEDGWFKTGDVGYWDHEGWLYIHDRINDVVISGGENIYPAEVEATLLSHPDIAEAAVIGRPDARWGEVPVAFLVLEAGASLDLATVNQWLTERLARYKHPRDVHIVPPPLPRTSLGKVQKFALREPSLLALGDPDAPPN
ncbi:MAG: AMP-binding protein [Pseudomonadota bacterium]